MLRLQQQHVVKHCRNRVVVAVVAVVVISVVTNGSYRQSSIQIVCWPNHCSNHHCNVWLLRLQNSGATA